MPGWAYETIYIHLQMSAGAGKNFVTTNGIPGSVVAGLNAHADALVEGVTYTSALPVLGGQAGFSVLAAPGNVGAGVSASLTGPLGNTISGTKFDNRTTVSDVFYQGTLRWNQGVNNEMVYITGNIPSGTYDPGRLANLSFGFVAFDVGGAYTYLNPQTGHEFSVAAGVTYSLPNPDLQTASIFISTGALPNSSPRMFRLAWPAIISSSSRRTAVPARSSAPSRAWRSALVRSSDSCFRSATCRAISTSRRSRILRSRTVRKVGPAG